MDTVKEPSWMGGPEDTRECEPEKICSHCGHEISWDTVLADSCVKYDDDIFYHRECAYSEGIDDANLIDWTEEDEYNENASIEE